MTTTPSFPLPPSPASPETAASGDMRAYFDSLSKQTKSDPAAEQAFIHSKMELVRSDPTLSEADKERAIAELRKRLGV